MAMYFSFSRRQGVITSYKKWLEEENAKEEHIIYKLSDGYMTFLVFLLLNGYIKEPSDEYISKDEVLRIIGDAHPLDYNMQAIIEKIKNYKGGE